MTAIATILFTVSASAWVGAILFQSAVVAPAVFRHLDEPQARLLLRGLFPRFFRFGLICGALMLAAVVWLGSASEWSATTAALTAATLIMIVLEAISLLMVPSINAARDAGDAGSVRFSRLHGTSVALTLIILLLGIGILATVAARAAAGA